MAHWLTKIPTKADWIVPFVIAALTAIGTLYLHHDDAEAQMQQRITALEQKSADQDKSLDHLTTQVDKLVEWALGSK